MANVPAGAMVAYAGATLDESHMQALGWLVCDGGAYNRSTYPDLYRVIKDLWGTAPEEFEFVVPDLRRQFLRGSSAARGVNNPQGYATAAPGTAFLAKLQESGGHWKSYEKYTCLWASPEKRVWRGSLAILETGRPAGGDAETLPVHVEVVWLICHSDLVNGSPVAVPASAVLPAMSDVQPTSPWAVADGQNSTPDLRGVFLRGSADHVTETKPLPYSTGWPTGGKNTTATLSDAPVATDDSWGKGLNRHPLIGTSSSAFIAYLGVSGGDAESRPVNVAADLLVAQSDAAALKAGMIIAYAADSDPNTDAGLSATTWLPCDGSSVSTVEYADLASAMPWAVVGSIVRLPHLADQFLRATDRGANVDKGPRSGAGGTNSQGTTEGFATGKPSAPWQLPTQVSALDDTEADGWGANQDVLIQHDQDDEDGASSFTASLSNWDTETRPANVAVAYWIAAVN